LSGPIFDLHGRVALVTGAGQNVGSGIAHALAAQGALVLVNDVVADRAEAVVEAVEAKGGAAQALPFDVTDLPAVLDAVSSVERVDILVNNAGNAGTTSMGIQRFIDMDPAAWEAPIRVNLYGVLNCCHAVVRGMCERGWGRVITISSGAATAGVNIGVAPYSAGKGGGILHPKPRTRSRTERSHREHTGDRTHGHTRSPGHSEIGSHDPDRSNRQAY
jgi:NAD(P)-dependent dehydrogenase (short-subunit alcohol dehydrogenase family)